MVLELFAFFFGAEVLPVVLIALLFVFSIRMYSYIHLWLHWWTPLEITGLLCLGVLFLGLILPKNYTTSQDIIDIGWWLTGHSIWFGYFVYVCSTDQLLFALIGLPVAILMVLLIMLNWMILGFGLIEEWRETNKHAKDED